MKRTITALVLIAVVLVAAAPVWADQNDPTTTSRSWGSVLLHFIGLLIAGGCALGTVKLHSALRGGKIASAWMWIAAAFGTMTFAQLLAFGDNMGFLPAITFWVDAFRLVALVLFFGGMTQIRRILA